LVVLVSGGNAPALGKAHEAGAHFHLVVLVRGGIAPALGGAALVVLVRGVELLLLHLGRVGQRGRALDGGSSRCPAPAGDWNGRGKKT
jgi:hypothetical protein